MTDALRGPVGLVIATLMRELAPIVRDAAPAGGWAQVYRDRGVVFPEGRDPLADPVFLLQVVHENPSDFAWQTPADHARALGLARQRFHRATTPGAAEVDPATLAESAVDVLAAFGVAMPPELAPLVEEGDGSPLHTVPGAFRLDRWRGDLLDLSRRNPLISLGDAGVRLVVDESDVARVEDIVAEGGDLAVRGEDDLDGLEENGRFGSLPVTSVRGATDLDVEFRRSLLTSDRIVFGHLPTRELRTKLTTMRRQAEVVAQETGASPLYLSVGGLRIGDDLAPLFLVPVEVEGSRSGPRFIHLQPGAETRLNMCLVELLRRDHGFVPPVLVHPPRDGSGIDVPAVFSELRRMLAARRFPFEVMPDMRLVVLRFSTMHMWRDLRDHAGEYANNPLVAHLMSGTGDFVDPVAEPTCSPADEYELTLPLGADSSQMKAVRWAREGRTFVVQGPPGTGKSQTIANIVADSIAAGRRVLFVAEKDAALDVVKRRLLAIGLGSRCLDLRDKDLTTRSVRTHLASTLTGGRPPVAAVADAARVRHRRSVEQLDRHPRAIRAAGVVEVDGAERATQVAAYRDSAARLRATMRDSVPFQNLPPRDEDSMSVLGRELRVAKADSVRDLLADHADGILTLTPCVLASPTAVATHLPPVHGLFDLVVFDEASQIRVESAVGAMGRGRAVVIVGDPQQMPPSDALGGSHEDGDDEQEESILLEASRVGLPLVPLTWHYRSRSEGLVAFSNERYYAGDLSSFPTPPGARADSGVEFRRVPGRFEAGRGRKEKCNRIEAREVVAEVERLLTADPDASVGVVTFNMTQRDVVLDLIEEHSPEVVRAAMDREKDPLIVKALEHIQGDERDHILLSLTYSTDDSGRLPSNFGLLSRTGGERRLNVAITRARVRTIVFASFDPTDVDRSSRVSRGPADLREYLLAARHGRSTTTARASVPDECRSAMATRLRAAGLEVREDIGLSAFKVDLAVRRPDGPWLAVLLDTDAWAARGAVADRDDIPYLVLGDLMGWAGVHQAYRGEFLRAPEVVVARIVEAADQARAAAAEAVAVAAAAAEAAAAQAAADDVAKGGGPAAATGVAAPESSPNGAGAERDSADVGEVVREQQRASERAAGRVARDAGDAVGGVVTATYRPSDQDPVAARSVADALPDRQAALQVAAQWRDVIAAEGPVHAGRAAKTVANRFGWPSLTKVRRAALTAVIPKDCGRTTDGTEEFLWGAGVDPATYRVVRTSKRAHRRIHEIAPEEIANAIRLVLVESGGRCPEHELLRGVSEVFGFGRMGHLIEAGIRRVLDERLLANGEFRREGHSVVLHSPRTAPEFTGPASHAGV